MSINFDEALAGWKQKQPEKKDREAEEMKEYLCSLIRSHKTQQRQLEKILGLLEDKNASDKLSSELRWYIAQSETTFLQSKQTVNYIDHGTIQLKADAKLETCGKWSDEKYSLTKEGDEYIFILPPMVSQYKSERRLQEGRAIQMLVLYLLDEFQKKGQQMEMFPEATIEFHHYIDINMPERSVPDPDNVDIKKVIDSLHGFIIESDNLLHLDLLHYGYLSTIPHTKVIIKKGKKAPIKTDFSEAKK